MSGTSKAGKQVAESRKQCQETGAGLGGSLAVCTIMKVGHLCPPEGAPFSDLHHGALWTSQLLLGRPRVCCGGEALRSLWPRHLKQGPGPALEDLGVGQIFSIRTQL